ncbi:hypothetical protein HPP92_011028, partial [Vanilla planifolia]
AVHFAELLQPKGSPNGGAEAGADSGDLVEDIVFDVRPGGEEPEEPCQRRGSRFTACKEKTGDNVAEELVGAVSLLGDESASRSLAELLKLRSFFLEPESSGAEICSYSEGGSEAGGETTQRADSGGFGVEAGRVNIEGNFADVVEGEVLKGFLQVEGLAVGSGASNEGEEAEGNLFGYGAVDEGAKGAGTELEAGRLALETLEEAVAVEEAVAEEDVEDGTKAGTFGEVVDVGFEHVLDVNRASLMLPGRWKTFVWDGEDASIMVLQSRRLCRYEIGMQEMRAIKIRALGETKLAIDRRSIFLFLLPASVDERAENKAYTCR